jgi:hypothetical protein
MKRLLVFVLLFAVFSAGVPFLAHAEHPGETPAMHAEEGHMETTMASIDCALSASLGVGSRGEAVSCLQMHLIAGSYLTSVSAPTGYFGEATKEAVKKWQSAKGVASTGYFGPLSFAAFGAYANSHAAEAAPAMHAHQPIDVATWASAPTVEIVAHPDAMAGWNLEIKTTNFRFAPEHASGAVLPNEGHAHLMVDGKKLARVYGNWFHIPKEAAVGAGQHEVLVTLNANDHSDLQSNGVRVEAKTMITVQ